MLIPRPPDNARPWHVVIYVVMAAALLLVSVARCIRAVQPREPSFTNQAAPLAPAIDVGSVSVGEIAQGTLGADERQAWTLVGTKGQRVAIAVFGAWDSHVTLLMPDGIQTLTQDGFSGGRGQALIDGVTLPVDGTYRIVVRGEMGGAGNYELHVGKGAPAAPAIHLQVDSDSESILIKR